MSSLNRPALELLALLDESEGRAHVIDLDVADGERGTAPEAAISAGAVTIRS
jgi:hypothetical protein